MDDFELTKNYLKNILDEPTFDKWILPLSYIGTKNNIAFVGSPDKKKTIWIKDNLLDNINKHTKREFNFVLKVVPLYDDNEEDDQDTIPSIDTEQRYTGIYSSNLQSRYTFESFVQVDQNRMAYSFARNVSEFPGQNYNPLYIYSDVGLGKTHLLYAIGNHIVGNDKKTRVIYSTTNDFMHDYVESNRLNRRTDFINKYISADVLLIDDLQYITKWEGTSEQFYYIFNKLIQFEKQIVLCCDKPPDDVKGLEKRIKSRFEWGSIVNIFPYDLEGRLAILKNKLAERRHMFKYDFEIPEEVLFFMASSIKDNVRKLEGALNRLIGVANLKFSDASGTKITIEFAKEALKPIISLKNKTVTIESIREFVAQKYNISEEDLVSKSNKREIAEPRQIAMYLSKKLTKNPLNEIGNKFGGKHHSTVLHSLNKIENTINNNPDFAIEINSIINFFKD